MNNYLISPELHPFQEHPAYIEGLAHIGAGRWQQAVEAFQLVQSAYPKEDEVKALLDEAQMRAVLAQSEPEGRIKETKGPNVHRLMVSLLLSAILAIAGYVVYELWINPVIMQEFRLRQITSLRNQADEAIATGDYVHVRETLQQLQAILPEDPQTIAALQWVEQVERSVELYSQAKSLMSTGSWAEAIEVLTELQSLDAQYRDLSQLLQVAQEAQTMDKQFQIAEEAFARGDWSIAIAQYKALQQANLTFRFDEVQIRLFESHLKYGQTLLREAGNDPNQVAETLAHFADALKLRPLDTEALNERRLAESYLTALNSTDQNEVINQLQTIYDQQPDYAGQAVAQLLYVTLLERAAAYLIVGNKAAAVADYQVAAQLRVEDPSEARQKLTELTSELASP